jgi:K(+)-stimulated pyrophosphate-energized sodium pump
LIFVVVAQLRYHQRGNDEMNKISDQIKSGSRAFLVTEYKYLATFVVIMFLLLFMLYALNPLSTNQWTDGIRYGLSFLSGAVLSAIAGWGGMLAATDANVRTTQAAEKNGLPAALRVAFTGGSVAGFTVVGLGMLGVSLAFFCLTLGYSTDYSQKQKLIFAADALAGFGFGASSIALFTRVAGGIFTKAADIGT